MDYNCANQHESGSLELKTKLPRPSYGGEDENVQSFDWEQYLVFTGSKAAPTSAFVHVKDFLEECSVFSPGMRLEVPCIDHADTFWFAEVLYVCGRYLYLRYESFGTSSEREVIVDVFNTNIYPVGHCITHGITLRPPKEMTGSIFADKKALTRLMSSFPTLPKEMAEMKTRECELIVPGMFVDLLDEKDPHCYHIAKVVDNICGRLKLLYEDHQERNLWIYYLDQRIKPYRWCIPKGYSLIYPIRLKSRSERDAWLGEINKQAPRNHDAIKLLHSVAARVRPVRKKHGMQVGMKLEAVHPSKPSVIAPATVVYIYDEFHFLVEMDCIHLTQPVDQLRFLATTSSPFVFPKNWCSKFGMEVSPPEGFVGNFSWESYLRMTKSVAAPDTCFEERNVDHPFQVGMKLEAVDQSDPEKIHVATISQLVNDLAWVYYDDMTASGERTYHVRSFDLFPCGWCSFAGHTLTWPRLNTLEQKNRISRLRYTAARQCRIVSLHNERVAKKRASSPPKGTKRPRQVHNVRTGIGRCRRSYRRALSNSQPQNEYMVDGSSHLEHIRLLNEVLNNNTYIPCQDVPHENSDDQACPVVSSLNLPKATQSLNSHDEDFLQALGLTSSGGANQQCYHHPSLRDSALPPPPALCAHGVCSPGRNQLWYRSLRREDQQVGASPSVILEVSQGTNSPQPLPRVRISKQQNKYQVVLEVQPELKTLLDDLMFSEFLSARSLLPKDSKSWGFRHVVRFLKNLGLVDLVEKFRHKKINGQTLRSLSERDLVARFDLSPRQAGKLLAYTRFLRCSPDPTKTS